MWVHVRRFLLGFPVAAAALLAVLSPTGAGIVALSLVLLFLCYLAGSIVEDTWRDHHE